MPILGVVIEDPEARKQSLERMRAHRRKKHALDLNDGFKTDEEIASHLEREPFEYENLSKLCNKAKSVFS